MAPESRLPAPKVAATPSMQSTSTSLPSAPALGHGHPPPSSTSALPQPSATAPIPARKNVPLPTTKKTQAPTGARSTSSTTRATRGTVTTDRSASTHTRPTAARTRRPPLTNVSSNLPSSRPPATGVKPAPRSLPSRPNPARAAAAAAAAAARAPRAVSDEPGSRVQALETQFALLQQKVEGDHLRTVEELKALKEQYSNSSAVSISAAAPGSSLGEMQLQAQLDTLRDSHTRDRRDWEERLERMRTDHADALERERRTVSTLQSSLSQQAAGHLAMESQVGALRAQAEGLRSDLTQERNLVASLRKQLADAQATIETKEDELRAAERLRRKLHNEVQELRGNIRVVARIRPAVQAGTKNGAGESSLADMRYPEAFPREGREVKLYTLGESASGTPTSVQHAFAFDRVLPPHATQSDVFAEVEHLAQSVLDGYNTCIFAYGQTGSGKTYTLEGPPRSNAPTVGTSTDPSAGLIPRTVHMLWSVAEQLSARGWTYTFSGQMVEIYLDGIIDLLSSSSDDPASSMGRHEIRHDVQGGKTVVVGVEVVGLHNPDEVMSLLARAQAKRQVAATAMNARSSRSHSVFTLSVVGHNPSTGEKTEAVLNLVDLAGSERLSNSGSADDPARLREAQSINKSLSALGDVIAALGKLGSRSTKAEQHVPYRNSTLTWLLKNSLGGNSKTLMLLNLSPLSEHQNETLCSLRFATKVNATQIGTARRTIKIE